MIQPIDIPPLLRKVLERAIWAPSGDNCQNWRFKILSENEFEIIVKDDSDWMVYDKEGHASLIAFGALLEYIKISASHFGYSVNERIISIKDNQISRCQIELVNSDDTREDKLFEQLKVRCVQRKPMGQTPLSESEKNQLEAELSSEFQIRWLETSEEKRKIAKILFDNAHTRYAMKEGFDVHSKVIDFRKPYFRFSPVKLPAMSIGVGYFWAKLTQLSLSNWKLFHFFEKYLGGTLIPRYLMEYKTAIHSSAHFILLKNTKIERAEDYIRVGKSLIRFWLKATELGLGFQPEHTPIIFSELIRNKIHFTDDKRANKNATKMDLKLKAFVGDNTVERAVYMGRVGRSKPPTSRSTRMKLDELIVT